MTQDPRDVRDAYRKTYNSYVDDPHPARRDRYAEFMRLRFGDKHIKTSYGREWARRFMRGTHMHKMDSDSMSVWIEVLRTSIDGTRAAIPDDVEVLV